MAMGDRDTRVRGGADGAGDARDNGEGHTGRPAGKCFFAAASKDEGVAALQPHDALPFERETHDLLLDFGLSHAVRAGALADVAHVGAEPGVSQKSHRGERVVEHGIRLFNCPEAGHGEQAGVTGACTHQPDMADSVHGRHCRTSFVRGKSQPSWDRISSTVARAQVNIGVSRCV
jgi:hypothetical protein